MLAYAGRRTSAADRGAAGAGGDRGDEGDEQGDDAVAGGAEQQGREKQGDEAAEQREPEPLRIERRAFGREQRDGDPGLCQQAEDGGRGGHGAQARADQREPAAPLAGRADQSEPRGDGGEQTERDGEHDDVRRRVPDESAGPDRVDHAVHEHGARERQRGPQAERRRARAHVRIVKDKP